MSCAEKARCKPRHSLLLATDEEDLIHKKWRQERPKFFYKCRPFSFSLAPPEEVKEEDEIQPLKEEVVVERVEEVCEEVASNKQKERNHYFGREARHAFFEKFNEVDARPATVFSRDASPREKFARALVAKLQIVREQANELGSDADFCLPEPIFVRSTQADSLMIGHRSYGDAAAVLLADIINDLPNLRHLSMRDNRLTDRGTAAILDAVCCGGSDNNTTNNAAGTAKRLLSLDLSMNVLDTDAVISIANFLRRSDCQLESLSLESADIDDNEISLLVLALDENKSLKELSIPHNYLGGFAEKLLVNEKRRGSLTIERVLKANSTLRKLDLSWNQLGSISGEAIARALGENRALTWLSIAYNCIGDEGSMAFGYALNWNKSLTFLDMSHNGIRNRGGQVIAEGLRENLRLTHLDVSGNPVGKLGGRALIKSLNLSLRQRKIVMRACDFAEDDTEQGRFNPASPAGTYRLDMSRPHDWMIAQSLLTLTVLRPGCKFVQLAETTSKNGEPRQIHLVDPRMDQRSSKRVSARSKDDGERSSNNSAKAAIAKMRQRIKSATQGETYESFIARNARTTSFGPGDFRKMVRELVMISAATISDAEILQLFSRIDSDNSGTIDANELEAFVTNRDKAYMAASTLQARFRGAIARIDMSQIKRMFEGGIQSTDKNESSLEKPRNRLLSARRHSIVKQKSPSQLSKAKFRAFSRFAVASSREMRAHMRALIPLDSKTMKPWKVPAPPAIITATFEEIPLPPTELSIHNATGINSLLTLLMDDCADRLALLRLASTDLRLFSIQVQHFVDSVQGSSRPFNGNEMFEVFILLLPRIVDVASIGSILRRNLSEYEIQQLNIRLGSALPIFCGAVVARHTLDLHQPSHRAALSKLVQVDAVYSSQQRAAFSGYTDDPIPDDCIGVYGGAGLPVLYRGGTSQNSDYSGFRNATLNGVPVTAQTLEEMAASFGDAGHDTNADLLQGRSMLQIDYAGVLRAPIGATAVSELKLGIILRKSGLRYNTNAQQDNPVLAQLLPDVMLDDWAEKQSLKRKENVVAARMIASPSVEIRTNVFTQEQPVNRVQGEFRTATPADKELLGRASVADVTDRESFFAWLGARGVPCQLWNAATREAAYEEFANYESKVECVREPKQKKKARRVAVDRHVHVIRVRICCSLLDRVLTWRLRTPSMTKADQTCNDDDDDDDEHSASTSSEEYRENGMSASKTHQSEPETTPQEGVKRKFLRAVASIAEGRDLRVQTFVTQRLPFDANGNIVVSSARAAVRAVASQLRSHLGFGALLELDEDSMRVVFRTQRHVSNSPLKPRSLIGMRTKAVVYYFEAYVPGLPDQMPSVGDWAYRWVSNDEAEDIPPQPEAFPKVVANFRVRTSSCYFMSAQVVRIIDSFIDLAKEQRMDVSEYAQSDNARRMDFDRGFQESRERQLALQPSGLNEEKRAYSLCALGVRELQHLHGRRRRSSTDARRHSVIALADSQKLSSMSPSNETNFGERNAVGAAISMLDSHMLELVVHLFGRTIDIERFYWTCVTRMPIRLRNNLIARIGWLNVLDAEHPETRFELDLRNADHWKLAHILTQLAAFEEGVNFCEATFCRSHLDPPIPGWSLPASWDIFGYTGNLARGIPRCGLLGVTYKAEPNDDNTPLRRRMKKLFTMLGVERPKEDPLVAACRVSASTLV